MPMPPYPVLCYAPGCTNPASYKVAAQWSDGVTGELKTYYLACRDCLATLYREAAVKRNTCRLAPGESMSVPGIFLMARGERDQRLTRCDELETQFGEGLN
jgi:hypothetical protein